MPGIASGVGPCTVNFTHGALSLYSLTEFVVCGFPDLEQCEAEARQYQGKVESNFYSTTNSSVATSRG